MGWEQQFVREVRRIADGVERLSGTTPRFTPVPFVRVLDCQDGDDITVALLNARDALVEAGAGAILLPPARWFKTTESCSFPATEPRTGAFCIRDQGFAPVWLWRPDEAHKTTACLRFGYEIEQPIVVPYGDITLRGFNMNTDRPGSTSPPDWGLQGPAIEMYATNSCWLDRICVRAFDRGFWLHGNPNNGNLQEVHLNDCLAVSCRVGTELDTVTNVQLSHHTSAASTEIDILIANALNVLIDGGNVQGNAPIGIKIAALFPKYVQQLTIQHVYTESLNPDRVLYVVETDAGSHHIRFLCNIPIMGAGTVYRLRGATIESRGNWAAYGTPEITVVDADAATRIITDASDVIPTNFGQSTYELGGAEVRIEQLASWP